MPDPIIPSVTCRPLLRRGSLIRLQGSSYAAVSEDGGAALGQRNSEGSKTARSRLVRDKQHPPAAWAHHHSNINPASRQPFQRAVSPCQHLTPLASLPANPSLKGSHYARRKGAAKGVFSAQEGIDATLAELRIYTGEGMEGDYL